MLAAASGNWGIGATYSLASPTNAFSMRIRSKDIHVREMPAVLHFIRLWLDRLHGTVLTIHCDN